MTIQVISDKSQVNDVNGVIVLESTAKGAEAYTELQGPDAKRAAIRAAVDLGLADPRVSGAVDAYPVDTNGDEITAITEGVAAIRADVPVTRRLV